MQTTNTADFQWAKWKSLTADLVKVLHQHTDPASLNPTPHSLAPSLTPLLVPLMNFLKSSSWTERDNVVFLGLGPIPFPLNSLSHPPLAVP